MHISLRQQISFEILKQKLYSYFKHLKVLLKIQWIFAIFSAVLS